MAIKNESDSTFESWLIENGATAEFVATLSSNGFTSKLALAHLETESDEAKELFRELNYGNRCLLHGLVDICKKAQQPTMVTSAISTAKSLARPKAGVRSTLRSLFRKKERISNVSSEDEDSLSKFNPTSDPMKPAGGKKRSRPLNDRGKYPPGKGKIRKVPETKLKVVLLPKFSTTTPTSSERSKSLSDVWIPKYATASQVKECIQRAFSMPKDSDFRYLYASGKNLRYAVIKDIENAREWDAAAVKTLQGSGFLYIVMVSLEEDGEEDEGITTTSTSDLDEAVCDADVVILDEESKQKPLSPNDVDKGEVGAITWSSSLFVFKCIHACY